jgi:hypothetical protein
VTKPQYSFEVQRIAYQKEIQYMDEMSIFKVHGMEKELDSLA